MKYDEFLKLEASRAQKRKRKPRHIEESIQVACVKWFRLQYPNLVIFAVPNGGSRNLYEAKNMKESGTLAGVADLVMKYGCLLNMSALRQLKKQGLIFKI